MKIRLAADLQPDSVVDGEGIRTVLWTQGCPHHCQGCQNPQTWDFKGGVEVSVDLVKEELDKLEGQTGLTLSGGDPFSQSKACIEICKYAKSIGLDIWCYTGFLYEDLLKHKDQRELLNYIDVLVDGPFIIQQFSLNLKFKGSKNQRIIDVPKSLAQNEVCLVEQYGNNFVDESTVYKKPEYIFI